MKGKANFLPIFSVPSVILNNKSIFYRTNAKTTVEAPGKLTRHLVELCDGGRTVEEVALLLKTAWDECSVRDLIKKLQEDLLLVDSRYLSDSLWKIVENPSHFPSKITNKEIVNLVRRAQKRHKTHTNVEMFQISPFNLGNVLNSRRSIRSFSRKKVPLQSVVNMLWSAYGETVSSITSKNKDSISSRTVPSAGALYPLMIHVCLFRQTGKIPAGVYRVHMSLPGKVGFDLVERNTEHLSKAFLDPLMLCEAQGVVVISGSFHATGKKYGNRSMLYVTLEAGHAAQNIHITASEHSVGTVEIGGFMEELLKEALKLPKHYQPLTTVVFGQEKTNQTTTQTQIETNWAIPMVSGYRLPFAMAFAKPSNEKDDDWSCGRSASPLLAQTKAEAEAKEWAACGCIPDNLAQARLKELETALDPRKIIKFHPRQYRLKTFPLEPFDESCVYSWVEGEDNLSGNKVHVLADCVYYPYSPKTPRYAHANSSGVAAHPQKLNAIQNGVLELVERDSFMLAYMSRIPFPTITERTLPQKFRYRLRELNRNGFKVWIKNYSLDLSPVVFIYAQNKKLTFTTCAGCSRFDIEDAFDHALMEVESSVLCRLVNGQAKPIKLSAVRLPKNHGVLYEQKQFFQKADFMIQGRHSVSFSDVGKNVAKSWDEFRDRLIVNGLQLITVPLTLQKSLVGNVKLHIIRSIVPGLVPITFGYQELPCGMERINNVRRKYGKSPILYRDLPKFPHPYT